MKLLSLIVIVLLFFATGLCSGQDLAGQTPADSAKADDPRLVKAFALYNAENYEAVLPVLGNLLETDSTNLKAIDLMGLSNAKLAYCRQAISYFEKGIRLDTANVFLPLHAAQSSAQCGFMAQAKIYDRLALERKPGYVPAALELSRILIQESNPDEAVALLTSVLPMDSMNMQLNYTLSSVYNNLRRYPEAAAAALRALRTSSTYIPAMKELGTAYMAMDSITLAAINYSQALSLLPDDQALKMNLAQCYYRRREYPRARALYRQIDRPNLRVNALVQAGMCYFFENSYDSALVVFQAANAIDSANTAVHFNKGLCYMELHKYQSAVGEFELAILLSKDLFVANAYDRLGTSYSLLGRNRKALEAYERALVEDPRNDRTCYNLGVLYETKLNNRRKAVEAYRNVVELARNTDDPASVCFRARERLALLTPRAAVKRK